MQKITYTNPLGESIVLSDRGPFTSMYWLLSYKAAPIEHSPSKKKGYKQDGDTAQYSRALPRAIDIEGLFTGNSFTEIFQVEETLNRIFNPNLHRDGEYGTLKYENDLYEREIDVRVIAQPIIPEKKNRSYNTFKIAMEADYPFFRDVDYTTVNLTGVTGGLEFTNPMSFEIGSPFNVGELSGSSGILANDGHKPADLRIEWTGVADNPKLTLEDLEKFILLDGSLTSDQRLIITTGYGDKSTYIETISTGEIVKNNSLIDPTSEFFSAPIGDSTVSFSADSGASGSLVTIKYKRLWI